MEIVPGVPEEITEDLMRLAHKIADANARSKTPVKMVSGEGVVVGDLLSGTWQIRAEQWISRVENYASGPHFVLDVLDVRLNMGTVYDFWAILVEAKSGRVKRVGFRRDAYFELLSSGGEEVPL